jgi:NAD(P)H dehydrogenase (quinone)
MILISGASGQLGRAVINHLLTTYKVPANKLIVLSRGSGKLADLAAKGVTVRKADFGALRGLQRHSRVQRAP